MAPLADYVGNKIPNHVALRGTIVASRVIGVDHGVTTSASTLRVSQWFGKNEESSLVLIGSTGMDRDTDCAGVFDFSASPGEEWLIFGQRRDGKVYPDPLLSIRLVDGKIPAHLARQLKKH